MTKSHRRLILLFVLMALALAGCNPVGGDGAPAGGDEQAAQATEAPAAEPTPTAMEEPTAAPEPTPTPEPEPTEVALEPPPAFSEDLRATDPQTVALGQGHPQLIEFFAFW